MADKSSSSTHEITYYLNVENAKIVAFIMVSGFIMYHGFIHVKYSKSAFKITYMLKWPILFAKIVGGVIPSCLIFSGKSALTTFWLAVEVSLLCQLIYLDIINKDLLDVISILMCYLTGRCRIRVSANTAVMLFNHLHLLQDMAL